MKWVSLFERLWKRTETALKTADKVVVIGYSMPQADQHARQVILKSGNTAGEVIICCGPDSSVLVDEFMREGYSNVRSGGTFEEYLGI